MNPKELKALVRIEIDQLWSQFEYREGAPEWSTRPLTDEEFNEAYAAAVATRGRLTGHESLEKHNNNMMYYWVHLKWWDMSFMRQIEENIDKRIADLKKNV